MNKHLTNPSLERRDIQLSNAEFLPEVVKLLEEGHTVTLRLRGFSMRPFLEDNRDKALIKKATAIQVGDPVLAEIAPKRYVLHRIIHIDGNQVTLLGDGNLTPEHCTVQDVKGSVVGFYRKGRSQIELVSGRKWRTYSWIWMRLRPVRRYLLALYRIVQ
ncbi:MAG: S24/S26 family peptidase [Prevotella sp.]|nr:S24/S26 family peptidase [Prevotella sp.]